MRRCAMSVATSSSDRRVARMVASGSRGDGKMFVMIQEGAAVDVFLETATAKARRVRF